MGSLASGLNGCRLVLATVIYSGGRLFWGSLVLGTVICSGDGHLFWRRSLDSGDGRLFWRRSSVLGVVRSGDGHLFWRRSSVLGVVRDGGWVLETVVCSGDGRLVLAAVLYWLPFWCFLR